MFAYKLNKPNPPKMPVMRRLKFVDDLILNSWMLQSNPIIASNKIEIFIGTETMQFIKIAEICPMHTPVHRAHTGN